jgi:hypothetical protein
VLNVLAWLLIVWAALNCAICLLIVGSATYVRISRTRLPVGAVTVSPLQLRRRHAARVAPIERYLLRPPEETQPKRRHLMSVV